MPSRSSEGPATRATFALAVHGDVDGEGDVLGVWRQEGPQPTTHSETVWRVDLATDLSMARSRLATGRDKVDSTSAALPSAATRLERVLSEPRSVAYDSSWAGDASPEDELRHSLDMLEGGGAMPSFSSSARDETVWWRGRVEELALVAERFRSSCSPTAWIETRAAYGRVARSRLTFGGDLATVWHSDGHAIHGPLHEDAVRLVVATRTTLVRALALATHGALGLVARLSNPATAVLAIPATWRFIQSVARETPLP